MSEIGRRSLLKGGAALVGARLLQSVPLAGMASLVKGGPAAAQGNPKKLTILANAVHQAVATQGAGGDATKAWREKTGIELEWVTLDNDAIRDRLLREASLSHTDIDIGFVLAPWAVPRTLRLFEPLDHFMASAPIEDFPDIQGEFVKGLAIKDVHYGIPFRHATSGLHFNQTYFKEQGIAGPPAVIDDLLDYARKLTFTRAGGTKVYGFGFEAVDESLLVVCARAFGGDFITADLKCVADGPGMIKALQLLRDLYKEGLMPPNLTAMNEEDLIGAVQGGQIAMTHLPFGRTRLLNDPKSSKFPGQFSTAPFPGSKEIQAKGGCLAVSQFWGMVIPKSSGAKEASWSLIRELSAKKSTIAEALNGNGPVRVSTYSDPQIIANVPYAAQEAKALQWARTTIPAFDKAAQAEDICVEEMQAVMLGKKAAEEAGQSMARRIQPLLPA